jgi:probable HAF family extracellular repeat protein
MKKTILAFFALLFAFSVLAQSPVYRTLPAGHILYGMSNNGNFAVGTNGTGAFLYKAVDSSITNLGGGEGWGVNNYGAVCGNFPDPNTLSGGSPCDVAGINVGGVWTALPQVPNYPPVQTGYSYAYDIADDGQTVCGMFWKNAGYTKAFIYNPTAGYTLLQDLNMSSRANYISDDGTVAAGWWQGNSRVPVRWAPAATALTAGEAQGLTYDGSKMMGDDNGLPYIWDVTTGLTTIPLPANANDGAVTGITDSGVVVGYYTSGMFPPLPRTAFIYFPGQGMQDLSAYLTSINCVGAGLPGTPNGISRNGRYISGNSSGFPIKAFFVDLGPSFATAVPSTQVLTLDLTAYPNPCSADAVRFGFTAAKEGVASISIYDQSGKRVRRLNAISISTGKNTIAWDRINESGQRVAAGTYTTVLEYGEQSSKIVLILQ